ncbi:hypothetical protein ACOMHN_020039 [Nucella lapillus]
MNKIRLNISGNTEEDAAKQQSTELKSAPKARKRLVLKEAKCGPVSVMAKQGAAIRVGLGLSETKHRVQRRYFRWLGVHFASERKEKKEQLKAQGAEIEGQMRTLEVWNDTEKNMDLTPTPCAGIKDIPSYVTRLLDEYDSQGRLTWHDGSIPEDEIWIKIGGDHGGKSFKMMLQVANLANANSKHNTCMFTIVECKDTPENLRRLLVPYKDQLSELETMQWKEKRTRVFVFGDYDFLTKMYGLSGAQGIHPCLYCTATKSAIQLSPDLNKRNISPRSVVQIKRDYKQYRRAGKKKKDAQLFNNVVRHPVIDVELEQVAPPYLHILLGIVKKHHDLLEDQCHKLDQQVARSVASGDGTNCDMFSAPFHKYIKDAKKLKGQQSHLKNLKSKAKREDSMELQNKIRQQENTISETKAALSLPIRAGPIAANLDKTLRENKIFPQAYHSRSLVGNHCNKYLREDAYKSICGSVSEITKDVTNRKDIQEKARGISGKFTHLNSMFSNVHQRISHQRAIGCEEIENIETCISTYMAYFRQAFPHVAVIPKQHLLEHHCVPWIRRWGTGMALLGEQGGEETHATVNSLKRRVDGLKNHQHRLKTLLREQLMLVAPAFHDVYRDFRYPPGHEDQYQYSDVFWHVLAARLAFVVVFENLVVVTLTSLCVHRTWWSWLVPNLPVSTEPGGCGPHLPVYPQNLVDVATSLTSLCPQNLVVEALTSLCVHRTWWLWPSPPCVSTEPGGCGPHLPVCPQNLVVVALTSLCVHRTWWLWPSPPCVSTEPGGRGQSLTSLCPQNLVVVALTSLCIQRTWWMWPQPGGCVPNLPVCPQNLVVVATSLIAWLIPDVPVLLNEQIRREAYITSEIILRTELQRAQGVLGTGESGATTEEDSENSYDSQRYSPQRSDIDIEMDLRQRVGRTVDDDDEEEKEDDDDDDDDNDNDDDDQ